LKEIFMSIQPLIIAVTLNVAFSNGCLAQNTVTINGKTASTDVRMIGGKPYVSLNDMARAMGMTLVRKAGGYQIVASGGATETRGRYKGKIGDDIFTGDWRFSVRDVKEFDHYTSRFGNKYDTTPKGPGDKLIVVTCRLKNGHQVKENMYFSNAFSKADNANLADTSEHGYEPIAIDVKYTYYNYGAHILPGAATDFALVFSVPKEAKPNDLIYRIFRYDDAGDSKKHTTVRVSLNR
jgi:hypothetical protein